MMEIFALNLSYAALAAFFKFGLLCNIIALFIIFWSMNNIINKLSTEEKQEIVNFHKVRTQHVLQKKLSLRIIRSLLWVLPMYMVYIGIIVLYTHYTYKDNLTRIIMGLRSVDEYSIVPLIKYKPIKINK